MMKILSRIFEKLTEKLPGIALAVLLQSSLECLGDFEPFQYESFKKMEAQTPMKEAIAAAQLDSQIFSATRNNFPAIRIIDKDDVEVPYLIQKAIDTKTRIIEENCRSDVMSLRELPENKIEITIRLRENEPSADGLTLITPHKNFERRVSVFGSEDGEYWIEIVKGALVFDYSRYMDVDNRKIDLLKNKFRLFRLEVEDVVDEKASPFRNLWLKMSDEAELEHVEQFSVFNRTFRIDRIDLWRRNKRQQFKNEVKANYPVAKFTISEDEEKKQTIIEVATLREPLTSLGIATPDRNFHRRAHVEVKRAQYGSEDWVEIGHATLSKIDFQGFRKETIKVGFPENRADVYRLVINNQDNQPLEISGMAAEGNVYEILYLNKTENNYRLFYGSETAEGPRYDFASVLGSMGETNQPVPTSLSAEMSNPNFNADLDQKGFQFLENKWLLVLITAIMVAALSWILVSTGRKI